MQTPNFNIEKVAHLARLKLTESERTRMEQQFQKILEYINQLNELNTEQVVPTSHVLQINNVLREDLPRSQPLNEDLLSLAPKSDKGHYEVPQIL